MRIRNTYSACARIVRKYEIGKSRVLRAVTLTDRSVCWNLRLVREIDLSRGEMENEMEIYGLQGEYLID